MADLEWHGDGHLEHVRMLERDLPGEPIDEVALRAYRIGRVREQMAARGIDALILSDAVNIRYASGTRNMQVFTSRNAPSRYLLLMAVDAILYEFAGCHHLADGIEVLTEVRSAITASFVAAGEAVQERERRWAREMAATLTERVGGGATVGVLNPSQDVLGR